MTDSIQIVNDKPVMASHIVDRAIEIARRQSVLPDLHASALGAFYDGYIEACISFLASVSVINPESWSKIIREAGGQ